MKKLIFPILLLALLPSCEKDDICDPSRPTTSRLIVTFYDNDNPTVPKNVNQLQVTALGMENPYKTFSGVSSIELPLRTAEDVTAYRMVLNSNDPANDNTDVLTFTYERKTQYVSRACGYKTVFELSPTAPVALGDADEPDGLWIKSISIENYDVRTEDETHIAIYY